MPFSQYSTLADTLAAFRIVYRHESFVVPTAVEVSPTLRDEIEFTLNWVGLPASARAIRENIIYPILKETWKHFPQMTLWSDVPLEYDADLSGTPGYFLARRSPLGSIVVEEPYLIVQQTRKDDFDWGWGQCLAGMLAVRKLNNRPEQIVYGIVTNGTTWQFGRLHAARFQQEPQFVGWLPLEPICAAVNFMFEQSKLQLANYAGAA
jgi:hypothetical protein